MAKIRSDAIPPDEPHDAAVRLWSELAEDAARSLGQAGEWVPWLSPFYADGQTLIDSDLHPVFDARSARLDRAIRIQEPSSAADVHGVGAWVATYGDEWDADMPAAELFVTATGALKRNISIVRELLQEWMKPSTTPAAMTSFIERSLIRSA